MEEFARRLKERMIDKNMTEAELAQKTELWPSILTSYLKGKRFPGYYTLLRIADALDVSIDFLLGLRTSPSSTLLSIKALARKRRQEKKTS